MPDPQSAVADLKQSVGDLFNADPGVAIVNATANVGNRAQQLMQAATKAAQDAGLDPAFVTRLIGAESNWNPFAVSKKGAQGLMQVLPSTAKQYGVLNLMNPSENIKAGVSYLKDLTAKYGADRPDLVAAAYNAGPGAVDKSGGVPPYAETKAYVQKVAGQDLEKLWQPVGDTSAWKAVDETPAAKDKGTAIYSNRPTTLADVGKGAMDVAIGAFKQPGRIVQMVPGVTALTDTLYGLPPGSSEKSMQPTNTAQEVGGAAADIAEMVAGGAASGVLKPAMALTDMSVFPVEAGSYASRAAGLAQRITGGLVDRARADLMNGGPVTEKKLLDVAYKFGKGAAKIAAYSYGAGKIWEATRELNK